MQSLLVAQDKNDVWSIHDLSLSTPKSERCSPNAESASLAYYFACVFASNCVVWLCMVASTVATLRSCPDQSRLIFFV